MKVSAKEEAGLLIMVYMAGQDPEQPVSLSDCADEVGQSVEYLEKVVPALKKANLLKSTRGVNGGYWLTRPATQINVAQVLRAISGDLLAMQCVGQKPAKPCPQFSTCKIHGVWEELYDRMEDVFTNIYLSDLVKEPQLIPFAPAQKR